MTTGSKFNNYVQYIGAGDLDLASDTLKVMLTNTLPVATNSVYSDVSGTEVSNGNGYTTGGGTLSGVTWTNSSGTSTLTANSFTWTASGGNIGPFRYAIVYDSTPSTKALLGWWDNGSSITLMGASSDQFVFAPTSNTLQTFQ